MFILVGFSLFVSYMLYDLPLQALRGSQVMRKGENENQILKIQKMREEQELGP